MGVLTEFGSPMIKFDIWIVLLFSRIYYMQNVYSKLTYSKLCQLLEHVITKLLNLNRQAKISIKELNEPNWQI